MSYEDAEARMVRLLEEVGEDFDDSSGEEWEPEDNHQIEETLEQYSNEDIDDQEEDIQENIDVRDDSEQLYIGKDGTRWDKRMPVSTRTQISNIIRESMPNVGTEARELKLPIECFSKFITDEMLLLIVDNTNKYITSVQGNFRRERYAYETNIREIKGLIGILLICGIRKCNRMNVKDLYNTNGSSIEIVRLVMSMFRFQFLLRCLRFDDLNTRTSRRENDKLAPIRELFNKFVKSCLDAYSPSAFVTVDEMLPAFRGRCNFRQYIPSKPNKYGIKMFALADAKTFYVHNLEVYLGNQPDGPFKCSNKPLDLVVRLCRPIYGSGRNVTMDNWFTSYELVTLLLKEHNLTAIGTLRKNKPQLPPEFLNIKRRQEKSSMFGFQKHVTLLSYVAKKKKMYYFYQVCTMTI